MTLQTPAKGINPAWSNLPRRKCDDCGKSYKPVRPVKKDERGFCSPNCRKSYHKHGGAYRKLKTELKKEITRQLPASLRLLEPCAVCNGIGTIPVEAAGTRSKLDMTYTKCVKCAGLGERIATLGREILDFLEHVERNPALR